MISIGIKLLNVVLASHGVSGDLLITIDGDYLTTVDGDYLEFLE
jgi:hypothetical protein